MSTPLTGSETGLMGYWRFDEGSGNHVTDTSGHEPNALLGGGVASQSPAWVPSGAGITTSTQIAPLSSRTIVFSEPVDPTTVSTSDFVLQGPGTSGSEPITSVSGSGATWVVGFDAIDNPGVYTLLVGPQIADIAGNVFDNNGNGIQGEATDAGHDVFNLIAPAQVTLAIDPASDSGAPDYPGYTNITAPTFDVTVNQAGSITMDFDGNPAHDQTLTASASGTYKFTAPTLSGGAYVATATFNAGPAGTTHESDAYTIDTVGPHVAAMSPSTTIRISASAVLVTFSEPVNLNTLTPSTISFTGPSGTIPVDQPTLVSGATYSVPFDVQAASGDYSLTIAPTVTDYAGNPMDQNQNGVGGEPGDSFSGSFTEDLPMGGPITLNTETMGFLPAGHVDDWTFFGRSGQTITTVLRTSDSLIALPPPVLDNEQVTLLDNDGNVVTTASSSQSGAAVFLSNITLPADGIYHVSVQATAGEPSARGFYDLLVADATVHPSPLTINQTVTGQLLDRYSVDAWTFSSTAGQQVTFNVVATASPDIEFDLIGPGGQSVFSGINGSTGPIDLTAAGAYVLRVHTVGAAGGYAFRFDQASQIPLTLNTPYQATLAGTGQSQLYNVALGASNPLEIRVTDSNSKDQNEIYVSFGKPPTRNSYDYRYSGGTGPNQKVVLTGKPGTYYILVYNNFVQTAGNYTIEADGAPFLLSGMNPTTIGNAGNTTVQLSGVFPLGTGPGGYVLKTAPTLLLVDQHGMVVPGTTTALIPPPFGSVGGLAGGVNPDGTMTVSAVIAGGVVMPGTYSVRVTDNSGYSRTLSNVLTVVQGGLGHPQDQRDRAEPDRLPRGLDDLRPVHQHRRCAPSSTSSGAGCHAKRHRGRPDDAGRLQDRLRLLDVGHARWL